MSFKKLLAATAFTAALSLPAVADLKTEEYVRTNAKDVLASLNAPELDAEGRRAQFQTYMNEFTNLDAVAKFVIGKYSRRFSDEEMQQYLNAFSVYALAVYEDYFNQYQGTDILVTGSTDRNARDSIVNSEIISVNGQKLTVRWRVLNRNGAYQVVDIALYDQGNLIWLAIEQRAQFLGILDKNNGALEPLIAKIDEMTAELVARRPE